MLTLEFVKSRLRRVFLWVGLAVLVLLLVQVLIGLFNRGSLQINTQPSGALVKLNGQNKGNAPINLGGLVPRSYRVEASLDGFRTVAKNVVVNRGEVAVNFSMESSTKVITVVTSRVESPVVTPDGRVLYVLINASGKRDLWSFNIKTSKNEKLLDSSKVAIDRVYWSEDGKAIISDRAGGAWLYTGGQPIKLPFKGYGFSWNKTASLVAFANDRFFSVADPEGISIYNLSSGKVTNIVSDKVVIGRSIIWSPDNSKLLYYEASDEGIGSVFVTDSAGLKPGLVAFPSGVIPSQLAWTSDSKGLYFSFNGTVYQKGLDSPASNLLFATGGSNAIFTYNSSQGLSVGNLDTGEVRRIRDDYEVQIHQSTRHGNLRDLASSSSWLVVGQEDGLFITGY